MGLAALLQPALGRLRQYAFGVKVPGDDGRRIDTGVQQLADEVINMFGPQPVDMTQPLILRNLMTDTPAIIILNQGGGGGIGQINNNQVVNVDNQGNITNENNQNVFNSTNNVVNNNINNVTDVVNNVTNVTEENITIIEGGGGGGTPLVVTVVTGVTGSVSVSGCNVVLSLNVTTQTISIPGGTVTG